MMSDSRVSQSIAEKSAYLTQTVQIRPSIFEFVAQEALNDLLHPALKKVIDFLALRHRTFVSVSKCFDEYFLFGNFLLQYFYLKRYSSTFSEKFYSLQRISLKNSKNNGLSNKELYLSLFTVVAFPYLRQKFNDLADKIVFDLIPRTNERKKIYFLKSLLYTNQGFNICFQLAKTIQYLRYLGKNTDIISPLLWIDGVKLSYSGFDDDADAFALKNLIPQLLQRSLELMAFFVQLLQYCQNEKEVSARSTLVPPPPPTSEEGFQYLNKCPICLKKRTVDTALSVSGFVFCFECITAFLLEHNYCPVTKLPATVDHLIRIYTTS